MRLREHLVRQSRDTILTGAVLVLTNLAWFVFLAIAARTLSRDEFGRLGMIPPAVNLIVTLADLGLTATIFRWLSNRSGIGMSDRSAARTILMRSVPLAAILAACIATVYRFPGRQVALITVAAGCLTFVRIYALGVLRAQGKPVLGALFQRGNRLLALPAAVLALYLGYKLTGWLAVYTATAAFPFLLFLLRDKSWFRTGETSHPARIPSAEKEVGRLFWLLSLLQVGGVEFDKFLIPMLASFSELSSLVAVGNVMMGYQLLQTALGFVLPAEHAGEIRFAFRRALGKTLVFTTLLTCLYFLLGSHLIHFAYGARYDHASGLVWPFIVLGCARVLYIVPSTGLLVQGKKRDLSVLLAWSVPIFIFQVFLMVVGYRLNGLSGVILAGAVGSVARFIVATYILRRTTIYPERVS